MEWRVRKPKASPVAGLPCSGRPFLFGDVFFGPAKKKSLGRGRGRKPALLRRPERARGCRSHGARRGAAERSHDRQRLVLAFGQSLLEIVDVLPTGLETA